MSVDIGFNKSIPLKNLENDKSINLKYMEDYTIIIYNNIEVLATYNQTLYLQEAKLISNIEIALQFIAHMYENYNVLAGFDGAMSDAYFNLIQEWYATPDNITSYYNTETSLYNILAIHILGKEMLMYNYFLSQNSRTKLSLEHFNNSKQYYNLKYYDNPENCNPINNNTQIINPNTDNILPF